MPRPKTGCIVKRKDRPGLWVRVSHVDQAGKTKIIQRKVENRTEGKLLIKKLLRELEDHTHTIVDGERMTFAQLAKEYEQKRLIAPVYEGEHRVAGLKSLTQAKLYVRVLTEHFGRRIIRHITHSDVEAFKLKRLATPVVIEKKNAEGEIVKEEKKRKVASVNRELEQLRNVFNFAKRSGWLIHNPFERGEPIISKALENKRDRIITRDEETRLLAACTDKRAHIYPIIICALDTAMRRGEIFKLKWLDVNLPMGLITIRASTTKTQKPRTIGMTTRLRNELLRLWEQSPKQINGSVFGISDKAGTIKNAWEAACTEADIEDLHFHDLRHSATTRMIQAGMPPLEVMKITGHSQMATFLRYLNADNQTAQRAASALDAWHLESEPMMKPATESVS